MIDPFDKFKQWYEEALEKEEMPDAMSLSTVDAEGRPSARMVLLKDHGPKGFVFYTNVESKKGDQISQNQNVAICLHWKNQKRQVRVEGVIQQVPDCVADEYFASRAKDSQIGAWASRQSRPLKARFEFEAAIAKYAAKYAFGQVPRPAYWTGFYIRPRLIEFWEDRLFRLHERLIYTREDLNSSEWDVEHQYP
jgi:pyridoxamine 5'-phosphate oxidase